jgi:L-rhamnose mutarotase
MSVYPGHEIEYEKRHRPIWPELEQVDPHAMVNGDV